MSAAAEKRLKSMAWLLPALVCAIPLVIGAVASVATKRLDGAAPGFYMATAGIAPVFTLALFVELALVMGPVVDDQGPTSINRAVVRGIVRANAGLLIVGEVASLYAIGTRHSTGFLLICAVTPWLFQLLLLMDTAYNRIGLSRIRRG